MPIDKVSRYTSQAIPEIKTVLHVKEFPVKAIAARDVIIINPCCEGGGDHALANKLANIALAEGCRITIVPVQINARFPINTGYRNINLSNKDHHIRDFHNPLFIVAPVSILDVNELEKTLSDLFDKYKFSKQDIVLIEELDLLTPDPDSLEQRETLLKKMGFSDVAACKLGFAQGSIGYLPIDQASMKKIKNRFEGELTTLLDSLNVTLDKESRYHLAYISYECIRAVKIFIANTLSENKGDVINSNYIMVTRSLCAPDKELLKKVLGQLFSFKKNFYNFPVLFSKVTLYFSDPETGKLKKELEVKGEGVRKVNVVFVKSLPENIFKDFMCLSHSGMASGDQSLGEFLSLTGKLPYYDLQPWKEPLAKALENTAEKLGGDELKREVSKKIVGELPFGKGLVLKLAANIDQTPVSPELKASISALDQYITAQTADGYIRALLTNARTRPTSPAPGAGTQSATDSDRPPHQTQA